jgi:YD repeat-containing protein
VRQKNGAKLVLEHDALGHAVKRTLYVSAAALSPEDRNGLTDNTIPLTTASNFNANSELVRRVYPTGGKSESVYDEHQHDPRARGNLLKITQLPSPSDPSDQPEIVHEYTYEAQFQQRVSATDPRRFTTAFEYDQRGNLIRKMLPPVTVQRVDSDPAGGHPTEIRQLIETFEYNDAGQMILAVDARGARTQFCYYPENDPSGLRDPNDVHCGATQAGGYLARQLRDVDLPQCGAAFTPRFISLPHART